jgi:hypothetical protein
VTSIQPAEVRAPETLDDLARGRQRGAVDVEPAEVPEVRSFHDQRISLPPAAGVAEPPGLRLSMFGAGRPSRKIIDSRSRRIAPVKRALDPDAQTLDFLELELSKRFWTGTGL